MSQALSLAGTWYDDTSCYYKQKEVKDEIKEKLDRSANGRSRCPSGRFPERLGVHQREETLKTPRSLSIELCWFMNYSTYLLLRA